MSRGRRRERTAAEIAESLGSEIEGETQRQERRIRAQYGALLALLFATFIFVGAAPPGRWVALVAALIESAALLTAVYASQAIKPVRILAIAASAGAIVAGIVQLLDVGNGTQTASAVLNAVLVLVAPVTVVVGLFRRRKMDIQTILGAVCIYVMIGLFFSFLFAAVSTPHGHDFFAQTDHASAADFQYFSFVTLTTVGYGDLTAAHQAGRTLAAFEAMVGQVYLVTVVALLVSNLGPAVRLQRNRGKEQDSTASPAAGVQPG